MLTKKQIEDYLTGSIKGAGLTYPNTSHIIDVAIPVGIAEFWGMHTWNDRGRNANIVVTATAETYDLPTDFDSIVAIREEETATGHKLVRWIKEDFDQLVGKQSGHATGIPTNYTIFKDNGKWKVSFFPRPNGAMNLPMRYHMIAPLALSSVSAKLTAVALAFIVKNCLPVTHIGRGTAFREAIAELEMAKNADKESSADITYFPTESDVPNAVGDAPWMNGWS